MTAEMANWKNHVSARLRQRDQTEKLPHVGDFTTLSQLEERFEIRKQILDDVLCNSSQRDGVEVGKNTKILHLQLRETVQKFSDLTTVLCLNEAELQYLQSRVSQSRQEARTLAKEVECQSKELATNRVELEGLKETLMQARREKDEQLQKKNDAQERWQRLAKQLKKHHQQQEKEKSLHVDSSH